ncbi:DUF202 domain-containing protein [Nocardioides sp. zg-DK7169]|uniref:DUF202 domain-containing protein n=1 Tax=Nocardioides sp. zg-DK7169 TaxID=2736600 RepID=UPI0015574E59|nr:DUF202 domain-containing protein [Nocardioides sp. zg-DK7169]
MSDADRPAAGTDGVDGRGPGAAHGDPGAANERTALAWQRSALALIAGAALLARLTWSSLGVAALVVLSVALVLSAWVFVESRGRYAHDAGTRQRPRSRGGRAPLALAIATALVGATELAALAVR